MFAGTALKHPSGKTKDPKGRTYRIKVGPSPANITFQPSCLTAFVATVYNDKRGRSPVAIDADCEVPLHGIACILVLKTSSGKVAYS
jgi:hypothetical protein